MEKCLLCNSVWEVKMKKDPYMKETKLIFREEIGISGYDFVLNKFSPQGLESI